MQLIYPCLIAFMQLHFNININYRTKMSLFGVQLNTQLNKIILDIRLKLSQNKVLPNFRTIYRSLVQNDPQVSGLVSPPNFQKAFNENNIFLKKFDFQVIEKAYKDQSGKINWFNFLSHLREPMGPIRRQLVQKIFDSIDTNRKGKLTPQQLMFHFNPNQIDVYKKNIKSDGEVANRFLSMISMPEGLITREQFIAFYDDCNINFHHNDVFNRFVSNQWHYTFEKLEQAKEDEIKAASKELRTKLIERNQGSKDQLLIRKLYEQFDLNQNYSIGSYEFDLLIKKFKLKVAPKIVEGLLQKIDLNKSGFIQYDEFKKYLATDPYPI